VFISETLGQNGVLIIKAYPSDATNASRLASANPGAHYKSKKYIFRMLFSGEAQKKHTYIVAEDGSISLNLKVDSLLQKCTWANCKTQSDTNSPTNFKSCSSCWSKADVFRGGVLYDHWLGKGPHFKKDMLAIDPEIPYLLSISENPSEYSHCYAYDRDGICLCFPEWMQPTALGLNSCTEIDPKFQNCIKTKETDEDELECVLCKPGFILDVQTKTCTCNKWTDYARAICNKGLCGKDGSGCTHCTTDDECLICDLTFDLCKNLVNVAGLTTENCRLQEVKDNCYQCNPGFVLAANKSECIELPESEKNTSLQYCRIFGDT
jgi:hypothetical protein